MATITEPSRQIPITAEVDVCVVGGGCAGVAAALAAARAGAKTALIERLGFLGGCGTATMMDVFWMYRAGTIKAVEGVGMEVLRRLKERGGVDGEPGFRAYVDSEMLKVLYDDMMKEAGVDLWFQTLGVRPIQEGN
jgi:flavin-dependent dehydrogenase